MNDVPRAIARHARFLDPVLVAEIAFRGWLRAITRNKVFDYLRRRQREPEGAGGTDALRRLTQLPAPASVEANDATEGAAGCW